MCCHQCCMHSCFWGWVKLHNPWSPDPDPFSHPPVSSCCFSLPWSSPSSPSPGILRGGRRSTRNPIPLCWNGDLLLLITLWQPSAWLSWTAHSLAWDTDWGKISPPFPIWQQWHTAFLTLISPVYDQIHDEPSMCLPLFSRIVSSITMRESDE